MTLDQAIEILEHQITYRDCFDNTPRYHAIKSVIKAIKEWRWCHPSSIGDTNPFPQFTEGTLLGVPSFMSSESHRKLKEGEK